MENNLLQKNRKKNSNIIAIYRNTNPKTIPPYCFNPIPTEVDLKIEIVEP